MKYVYFLIIILSWFSTQVALGEGDSAQSIRGITRIQFRQSNVDNTAWSQSTFIQFNNKFYFLDLFDQKYDTAYPSWHLDINVGKPIEGIGENSEWVNFDWVARAQKYQDVTPVLSIGLQWDFTDYFGLKKIFGEKTQSFIQIFPLKTNDSLGRLDVVHYYSIPLFDRLTLRGYNQYIIGNHRTNLFYPWADVIYSVNKKIDIYNRITYLSSHDNVLGNQGVQYWIGVRLNFAL